MATTFRLENASDQRDALKKIVRLIEKGSVNAEILKAAKILTRECSARDDLCELEAIFYAVKDGDSRVPWLRRGVRYVADPHSYDTFHGVASIIELCSSGACAFDCDDSTILIGALASAVGFKVGARAWGKGSDQSGDYQHVYPVACVPKNGPWPKNYLGHGLDVTVHQSEVGWEPPGGHIMTAWVPD